MSDKTRRETAATGTPHPARHPLPRATAAGRTAVRTVPRPDRRPPAPRGRRWPDARTAEALLAGSGAEPPAAPPTAPADRLVRLLTAAREVSAALDPEREAAAVAAFRDAAEGRAAEARGAYGRGLGAVRGAFAVRRPRMVVAAVASALALGGVAVGMAAARTSPPGGGGSGTAPLVSRPPAAVSVDSGRTVPRSRPPATTAAPAPPGSSRGDRRAGSGSRPDHPGRACGRAVRALCPPAASQRGEGAGRGDGRGQPPG